MINLKISPKTKTLVYTCSSVAGLALAFKYLDTHRSPEYYEYKKEKEIAEINAKAQIEVANAKARETREKQETIRQKGFLEWEKIAPDAYWGYKAAKEKAASAERIADKRIKAEASMAKRQHESEENIAREKRRQTESFIRSATDIVTTQLNTTPKATTEPQSK